MIDLFASARDNIPSYANRYDRLVGDSGSGKIVLFARVVGEKGEVVFNMRDSVLLSIVDGGVYLNIYEWASEQPIHSLKSAEDLLKEKLGPYYEKRMAFDSSFRRGENFKYAALSIGGLGAQGYGRFCVVMHPKIFVDSDEVVYLPHDSLKTYVGPGNKVNLEAITSDVACHEQRDILAAIKHAKDLDKFPETEWSKMLCSENDYIEVVFIHEVERSDIFEVRYPKSYHDYLFHLAFNDNKGELSEAERIMLDEFATIRDWIDSSGTQYKVIEDA